MESFGEYTILRRLSVGGVAEVYLATKSGLGGFERHLAIKRLLPDLSDETDLVAMFLDEARLVARLSHPHIAQVFDVGVVEGDYYLAMEYVAGATLKRMAKLSKREDIAIPMPYLARIGAEICSALGYAHDFKDADGTPLRIVHRDIKPGNLMLSYDGVTKVLDFGIAKAARRVHRTQTSSIKGTVPYMSPEQVQGHSLDRRSDIFSLGATLYHLAVGRHPFQGPTQLQFMESIVADEPADPRSFNRDIPDPVVDILLKALQKDRTKRYQTAREMGRALEAFLRRAEPTVDASALAAFMRQLQPPTAEEVGFAELTNVQKVSQPRATEPSPPPDGVFSLTSLADKGNAKTAVEGAITDATDTVVDPKQESSAGHSSKWAVFVFLAFVVAGATGTVSWLMLADNPEDPQAATAPATAPAPPVTVPVDEITIGSRARPKRPAPATKGRLVVVTAPPVDVKMGRRSLGRTPLSRPIELKPGAHKLKLVNRALGIEHAVTVDISAGKTTKLNHTFHQGTLVVFVKPFGRVFVDGVDRGMTPLEGPMKLYEGVHQLRVVAPATGKEEKRKVRIAAGETQELRIDLR